MGQLCSEELSSRAYILCAFLFLAAHSELGMAQSNDSAKDCQHLAAIFCKCLREMKGLLQQSQSVAYIPEVHTIFRRCHDMHTMPEAYTIPGYTIPGVTMCMYGKAMHLKPRLHVHTANTMPVRTINRIENLQATPGGEYSVASLVVSSK